MMRRGVLAALALAVCVLAVAASSAVAADFTWSGEGAPPPFIPGSSSWSNATNWVGATAPNGSIGRLTFPAIGGASSGCSLIPPAFACYQSINDIVGLNVSALSIDDSGHFAGGALLDRRERDHARGRGPHGRPVLRHAWGRGD